jgi:hypothetical protein
MQTTNLDMINSAVQTAKYRLAEHRAQGQNSSLSIFQVARLMDAVRVGEAKGQDNARSGSFSLN